MDKEFYAVVFRAGSSGRFIANIIWGSMFPNKYSFKVSTYNSAHEQSVWAGTTRIKAFSRIPLWFWSDKNFFNRVVLTSNPAMITCHSMGDFNNFFERFPFGKIVIITLQESDLPEVYANSILKNGVASFKQHRNDPQTSYILNMYKKKYGNYPTVDDLDDDFLRELIPMYFKSVSGLAYAGDSYFMNVNIDSAFSSKVLSLPYSDIVNNKVLTLSKISDFIKKDIPKNVIDFYDEYLEGRQQLLSKYIL